MTPKDKNEVRQSLLIPSQFQAILIQTSSSQKSCKKVTDLHASGDSRPDETKNGAMEELGLVDAAERLSDFAR